MDEIINVIVNGNSLKKDSDCAGVQGECNSTKLRISFNDNWNGYAKLITFWNALGENPVKIQLGSNLLEDILSSHSVYIVPLPGEAMTEAGYNTFVIHGVVDGTVKRTVEGKLKVLPSRQADDAGEPQDPTPTQAEQLRAEIDAVLDDLEKAAEAANSAAVAQTAAEEAVTAKNAIKDMTVSCETLEGSATATIEKTMNGEAFNLHLGIPKSESGVHVGSTPPTNPDVNVWVIPDGEADGDTTPSDGGNTGGSGVMHLNYGEEIDSEAVYNAFMNGQYVFVTGMDTVFYYGEDGIPMTDEAYFSASLARCEYNDVTGVYDLCFTGVSNLGNNVVITYGWGWTAYFYAANETL